MATQVQIRRGTATENDAFTGASGELTFDTTNKRVRVHDGSTAGGFELKTETSGGDTLFADNEKAIFGAGSDLQIYHDGQHSRIVESGTGQLKIQGTELQLYNADATKLQFQALDSGEVSIYYNNSKKLATTSTGVDITGTLTSDGLTVDGTIASGDITITDTFPLLSLVGTTGGATWKQIVVSDGSYQIRSTDTPRLNISTNGDISFYDSLGSSQSFFWDASAERLGIGVGTSPDAVMHVGEASYPQIRTVYTGIDSWDMGVTSGGIFKLGKANAADSASLFQTDSGNVGIGATSPSEQLTLANSSSSKIQIKGHSASNGLFIGMDSATAAQIWNAENGFMRFATNDTEAMRIDSSGNLILKATSDVGNRLQINGADETSELLEVGITSGHAQFTATHASGGSNTAGFIFRTRSGAAGTTEKMRLDSDGNLLVGHTDRNTIVSDGTSGALLGYDGFIGASRLGSLGEVMVLNREDSDGGIMSFRKDGFTVGSIGTNNGFPYFGDGGNVALQLVDGGTDRIQPSTGTGAAADNSIDLGQGSNRFKDLYLSGGVYLGGIVSANKLDDYEETNSSVTFGASTSGTVTIKSVYNEVLTTKIGHIVHVQGGLRVDSVSSPVGVLTIDMPFTFKDGPDSGGKIGGAVTFYDDSAGTWSVLPIDAGEGTTTLFIQKDASTISANDRIYINISYRTT